MAKMNPLPSRQALLWILLITINLAFVLFFFQRAVDRHHAFSSTGDLAAHEQVQWNTIHGRPLQWSSVYSYHDMWRHIGIPGWKTENYSGSKWNLNAFGIHLCPSLLLIITPFYRIFPVTELLMFLQILYITAASFAVFLLARNVLKHDVLSFLLAVSFLLHPALGGIVLTDFHPVPFSIPAILFAFYFYRKQWWPAYFTFLGLALFSEEVIAIVTCMLGLYMVLVDKKNKIGLITAGIGLAWFFIAFDLLIPHFNPAHKYTFFGYYSNLGSSQGGILKQLFFHPAIIFKTVFTPAKLSYVFKLFLPTAFLGLFTPAVLLTGAGLAQNLLTANIAQQLMTGQYNSILMPFIYISLIFGIRRLLTWSSKIRFSHGALLLGILVLYLSLFSNIQFSYYPMGLRRHVPSADDYLSHQLLMRIPNHASVSAYNLALPHLARRKELYLFPIQYEKTDYVVLSNVKPWYLTQEQYDFFSSRVRQACSFEAASERLTVFKRNEKGSDSLSQE